MVVPLVAYATPGIKLKSWEFNETFLEVPKNQ